MPAVNRLSVASMRGLFGPRVFMLAAMAFAGGLPVLAPHTAQAQTLSDMVSNRANKGNDSKRLTLEAREMVYDNDHNTVAATGDVILYYDGRKLEADRVTYDRNTRRVFAQGNAKMTESDGTVSYGDRFELTDDFKDGFIDSLRVVTKSQERFSSPRAERTDGETTVFNRGIYTACKPCAEHPERPPLWQVRAARIIHKNSEQTIYYENANLEFFGLPIIYIPMFSGPDPSVTRRSGFLAPVFSNSKRLGFGTRIQYFWAIAPNYDVTFMPTLYTRQGVLAQAEWRHRLENGQYTFKFAGINQMDRTAFLAPPDGAGNKTFRGSLETTGKFYINKYWSFGWDVAMQTDRYFFHNYKVRSYSSNLSYIDRRDSTSTVYLNGQAPKSWFDMRGYYFQGVTVFDWQKNLPVVGPVIDYNRRFQPPVVGGELSVTANFTNLHRDQAHFAEINPANPFAPTRLLTNYDGCVAPLGTTQFSRSNCILRGFAGNYSRASVDVTWRRQFIDDIGQMWTPFIGARVDGAWKDVNNGGRVVGDYSNAQQGNFLDTSDKFLGRVMPTVGLNYRFPFLVAAPSGWGNHVIEPIAQIVASPNESRIGKLPNEDAQSLVFDDTNLFSTNKFSGFDRTEGGTRASLGLQYTGRFDSGGYINAMFGQTYQLAGRNSFQQYAGSEDLANTGSNSGLDKSRSDYVGRVVLSPGNNFNLAAHARFNAVTMAPERIDVTSGKTFTFPEDSFSKSLSFMANYTRILPQPLIGYDQRREGLSLGSTYALQSGWFFTGAVLVDLDRGDYNRQWNRLDGGKRSTDLFNLATTTLGIGYKDECTTFTVSYVSSYSDLQTGQRTRDNTVMFSLQLTRLGTLNYRTSTDPNTPTVR